MKKSNHWHAHFIAVIWPGAAVLVAWLVRWLLAGEATAWGIHPRHADGLPGILFSPFIHHPSDVAHLANNSVAFLFMGWMLFYFYRNIAWKVWWLVWLAGGTWTWILGRPAIHLGMSGWIYGFGFFLVLSAIMRKNRQLMAGALLLVFEYGSMVWGILPVETHISWEGHFTGALAGIMAAVYFRGASASHLVVPPPLTEDELSDDDPWWMEPGDKDNPENTTSVKYHYKPKNTDNQ